MQFLQNPPSSRLNADFSAPRLQERDPYSLASLRGIPEGGPMERISVSRDEQLRRQYPDLYRFMDNGTLPLTKPTPPTNANKTQWDCSSGLCRPIRTARNLGLAAAGIKGLTAAFLPVSKLDYSHMNVTRPDLVNYNEAIQAAKQAGFRDVNAAREAGSSNLKRFLAARALGRDTGVAQTYENQANMRAQQMAQYEADKRGALQYNNQMDIAAKQYHDQGLANKLYGITSAATDAAGVYNNYVQNLAYKKYLDMNA